MWGRVVFGTVAAVLLIFGSALAKPGRVILPAESDVSATDVAAQKDGKVVVAGFSSSEGNGFVWRLKENGKIDRGFADDGVATIDSGGNERLFAVEIQRNGRILVAGSTNVGGGTAAIYRLRKDGTADSSFDTDGALGIDSGGFEELSDIALRPGGAILVAGSTTVNQDGVLYQVKENGGNGAVNDGLDDSFAGDGAFGIDTGGGDIAYSLAVQKDGKVVVVGASSVGDAAVAHRIEADGSDFDTDFGDGGTVQLNGPTAGQAFAYEVAVQRDRKVVVVGRTPGADPDAAVWRLKKGGGVDHRFSGDGRRPIDFGKGDVGFDLELLGKGRILVTGGTGTGSGADAFVAKLTGRGRFDRDFKGNGKRAIKDPGDEVGNAIDVDRDGRILVAGSSESGGPGHVFRLKKRGAIDKPFGP
jgi:uncharacterized delta-60 repeat protein